jgi:hypothetical protein
MEWPLRVSKFNALIALMLVAPIEAVKERQAAGSGYWLTGKLD